MIDLPIVHHPDYVAPLPPGHRFPMNKYGLLREELFARGLAQPARLYRPEPAPRAWVELAHAPDYVAKIFEQSLEPEAARRIGFQLSDRVVRRARLSTAGTALAARLALDQGIACQTAGGSHHAYPGFGAGFCVFNDVGVAARLVRAEGLVDRILVIDLDVHQGDGTAAIFEGDPAVFTFSLHAEKNFPVRKARSDLDIGLADACGDAAYLAVLDDHLAALIDHHRPDLIFYNAGVDPHEADRLGRLALSEAGLTRRDAQVIDLARQAGVPLVTVLGGGYGQDKDRIARLHGNTIAVAAWVHCGRRPDIAGWPGSGRLTGAVADPISGPSVPL